MSQETLSRKLTIFQNKGWIKQEGQRKIKLLNNEALKNVHHN
jgi:CRP/FNR family transcriptional regulator